MTPPVLRGGVAARVAGLFLGLVLFGSGIVAMLESSLGLSPWDVLNQGLERRTILSFGIANVVVGLSVLALAASLGARIGFGTFANAVGIGLVIEALLAIDALEGLSEWPVPVRAALLLGGIALVGVGSAFYIGAAMGAGPRDSLMLVGAERTGRRVGAVRAALEITVLVVGWALGGTVGVGTLAFALLVGPSVEASFGLLRRSPLARRAEAVAG
jgi:uncharacterized membrane protein YczE